MRNVPVPIRMGAFDLAVCTDGQQWLVIDQTHRSTIDYVFPERELAIAVAVRITKTRGVDARRSGCRPGRRVRDAAERLAAPAAHCRVAAATRETHI